jgi:hypothetical protein
MHGNGTSSFRGERINKICRKRDQSAIQKTMYKNSCLVMLTASSAGGRNQRTVQVFYYLIHLRPIQLTSLEVSLLTGSFCVGDFLLVGMGALGYKTSAISANLRSGSLQH